MKVGETYCHLHAQLLNPSPEELQNFLLNCEKDFDSHLHHILHLDDLLANDARHCIQLGYPVINYPRYIPTMVELCRASLADIIDKLKANLAYFKDDLWNREMFKIIYRPMGSTPCPRPGQGAGTPNPLDTSMGGPGLTTPRGNPPPWATSVPSPRTTPAPLPRSTPVPPPRTTPAGSPRNTLVPSP